MTKQTKKYEFTKETQEFFGHTLHRIVATRNFGDVKAGDLGGWIETEDNLSHDRFCWVYDNAWVFGKAVIKDQTHLTQGNHDGEVIKETQADPSEVVTQLRQENEELKAKLKKLLDVINS